MTKVVKLGFGLIYMKNMPKKMTQIIYFTMFLYDTKTMGQIR